MHTDYLVQINHRELVQTDESKLPFVKYRRELLAEIATLFHVPPHVLEAALPSLQSETAINSPSAAFDRKVSDSELHRVLRLNNRGA